MNTRWFLVGEVALALGLLALNLCFVIERYAPPSDLSEFAQGVFLGLSISANVLGIILLTVRATQSEH